MVVTTTKCSRFCPRPIETLLPVFLRGSLIAQQEKHDEQVANRPGPFTEWRSSLQTGDCHCQFHGRFENKDSSLIFGVFAFATDTIGLLYYCIDQYGRWVRNGSQ